MKRSWLLAALLALGSPAGCQGAGDPRPPALPVAPEARIPLWELAPPGATFGVVVQDGAAARLASLLPFAEGSPLQELAAQLAGEISPDLPLNLVAAPSWTEIGLDPRLGAALFTPAGEAGALFVLPVGDRALFRRALRVQVEPREGRELDAIGRGYRCTMARGRYLCARTLALLDQAVTPHDAELSRALRAMPRAQRGDIEVYADGKAPEMQPITSELRVLGDIRAVSAMLRLGPSSIAIEALLAGEMSSFLAGALRGAAPPPALAERLLAAPTALRVHLDPTLIVARLLPFAGAELRAALLEQLTGDLALITSGEGPLGLTLMLPLKDAATVEALLPGACSRFVEALERYGTAEALPSSGKSCAASFQPGKLRFPLFATALPLHLAVDGKQLVLHVGEGEREPSQGSDEEAAGSPARLALEGPETFAFHTRALQLGPEVDAPGALHGALPWLDPRSLALVGAWNQLGARLDEVTIAARVRPDGLRLSLDLRVAKRARLGRRGGPWLGAGALALALLVWLEQR